MLLFIAVAPVLILYSQGYRLDFDSFKIVKTGGIFLKIFPKQTEIYLDGKPIKKTDFFFGSALIGDLLPKKYAVKIAKEDYQTWEKRFEVQAKMVSEAKFIVLFPEKIDFSVLAENAQNFWLSPDGKEIIFQEPGKDDWALKLYDLKRNIKSHLIGEKTISSRGAELISLEWPDDSREIFLKVAALEQEKNFVLKLDSAPLVLTERKIPTGPKGTIALEESDDEFYYLDNLGNLYITDSSFTAKIKLNQIPFKPSQETKYELEIISDFIFLAENENLYLLNKESGAFEKFFDGIKDLKISPDKKKMVFFSDSEIWILFLKDSQEQPQKKSGEKLLLFRTEKEIEDVFWLNPDYLVFWEGGAIRAVETDDRDKIQIWDIGKISSPLKMSFSVLDNKIYALSGGEIFFSESILTR